jgi:hypothetical protein
MTAAVVITHAAPGSPIRLRPDHGDLLGTWMGHDPAAAGEEHHVELDIQQTHDWSRIEPAPPGSPAFAVLADGSVRITGEVLDLDEHHVLALRAGGLILLVETSGDAPPDLPGMTVGIVVDDLRIYPIHL